MLCLSLISLFTLFSLIFSVFFSDFPVFPDPPVRTKTFFTHNQPKTTTTCAENVLTLTPECFHRHVFLLPLHSSLISVFSLYSVFSLISLFSLTLPCVLKRFPLTTSRKTTTMCAENVLPLTPGDTEHDVLPLTPTTEFHPQDKPRHRPGVPCRTYKSGRDAATPCFWKH